MYSSTGPDDREELGILHTEVGQRNRVGTFGGMGDLGHGGTLGDVKAAEQHEKQRAREASAKWAAELRLQAAEQKQARETEKRELQAMRATPAPVDWAPIVRHGRKNLSEMSDALSGPEAAVARLSPHQLAAPQPPRPTQASVHAAVAAAMQQPENRVGNPFSMPNKLFQSKAASSPGLQAAGGFSAFPASNHDLLASPPEAAADSRWAAPSPRRELDNFLGLLSQTLQTEQAELRAGLQHPQHARRRRRQVLAASPSPQPLFYARGGLHYQGVSAVRLEARRSIHNLTATMDHQRGAVADHHSSLDFGYAASATAPPGCYGGDLCTSTRPSPEQRAAELPRAMDLYDGHEHHQDYEQHHRLDGYGIGRINTGQTATLDNLGMRQCIPSASELGLLDDGASARGDRSLTPPARQKRRPHMPPPVSIPENMSQIEMEGVSSQFLDGPARTDSASVAMMNHWPAPQASSEAAKTAILLASMDRMPQNLEVEEQSWRQEMDEEEDNVVLVPCEDQMFGQVVWAMEDGGRVLQSQDEEADSRDASPVVSEPTDPAEQVRLDGNHYRAQGDADYANTVAAVAATESSLSSTPSAMPPPSPGEEQAVESRCLQQHAITMPTKYDGGTSPPTTAGATLVLLPESKKRQKQEKQQQLRRQKEQKAAKQLRQQKQLQAQWEQQKQQMMGGKVAAAAIKISSSAIVSLDTISKSRFSFVEKSLTDFIDPKATAAVAVQ